MELDKLEVVISADDSQIAKDLDAVLAKFNNFFNKVKQQAKEQAAAIQDSLGNSKGAGELEKSFNKLTKTTTDNFKQLQDVTKQLAGRMDEYLGNSTSKARNKVGKDIDGMIRDIQSKMKQANAKQGLIGELQNKRQTLVNSGDTLGVAKIDDQIAKAEAALSKLHGSARGTVQAMKQEFSSLPQSLEEVAAAMESNEVKINQAKEKLKALQEKNPKYMKGDQRLKHNEALTKQGDKVTALIAEQDRLMRVYGNLEERSKQLKAALAGVNTELEKQRQLSSVQPQTAKIETPRAARTRTPRQNGFTESAQRIRKPIAEVERANQVLGRFSRQRSPRISFTPFARGGNILRAFTRRLLIAGLAYKTFSSMAGYVGGVISANSQLAASLNAIKVNLATAFYPIIQAVIPILQTLIGWLSTAIGWLASFIALLFGTTVSAARQGAQSMSQSMGGVSDSAGEAADDTAEAAKKMKQSFLGIDEINTLDQDDDDSGGGGGKGGKGGGGGGGGPAGAWDWNIPEPQLPKWLTDMFNKIKPFIDKMVKLFQDGFKSAFNPAGIDKMMAAIDRIGKNLAEIFTSPKVVQAMDYWASSMAYSLGQITGSIADIGLTIAENLIGGFDLYLENNKGYIQERLASIFRSDGRAWELVGEYTQAFAQLFEIFRSDSAIQITSDIMTIFGNGFLGALDLMNKFNTDMMEMFITPFTANIDIIKQNFQGLLDAAVPIFDSIADAVTHAFDTFNTVYDEHLAPFIDGITQTFTECVRIVNESWQQNIQPILTEFGQKFQEVYETYAKPAMDNVMSLVGKVGDVLKQLWDSVIDPFMKWLSANILPILSPILKLAGDAFLILFKTASQVINDITDILKGILDFLSAVFSGDWDKAFEGAKAVIEGFGNLFSDVFNGLADIFKTAINWVIGLINGFIGGLNQIKLPDFLGGFGVNIPTIPYLARGGVIESPTVAMIGEAGKEAVMPLENNTGWMNVLAGKLANLMPYQGAQPTQNVANGDIIIQIGDREFGRFAINEINKEQERAGMTLLYV